MKQWGGRFTGETDLDFEAFSSSIQFDSRLWKVDLRASRAHARMLGRVGVITLAEADQIIAGLLQIESEIQSGKMSINWDAEDIHSDMETKLFQKIGPVAGKLHTARSRNDQVATDLRLHLREEIAGLNQLIKELQSEIVIMSEQHILTVLPGMTHLQHAQPISLAHHLLAYFWMLDRDRERLQDLGKRVNVLPLGSAALAGTGFPIDRRMVATELGFAGVSPNSLDAVSDRDFAVEFLAFAALVGIHSSRFCEEMILWSTPEFGFVQMSDAITTGSSIMPQKKNPDAAELVRGQSGRLIAALNGALVLLKGLPLSYNRDLQEDKRHLFEGLDALKGVLRMWKLMLTQTHWRKDRMAEALRGDFSNATDLADDLVRKGLAFREAHEIVGHVVTHCEQNGLALESLSLAQLQAIDPRFDQDSLARLPHLAVMEARISEGGTSSKAVRQQLEKAKQTLASTTSPTDPANPN